MVRRDLMASSWAFGTKDQRPSNHEGLAFQT